VRRDPTEPAVADGIVYVSGAPDGGLAAVPQDCRSDGAVCDPIWTGDIHGTPTSRVIVSNGVVYLGSSDGSLYAFPATCEARCPPSQRSGSARPYRPRRSGTVERSS
jgi:outer membrane protein assembly factor BamB